MNLDESIHTLRQDWRETLELTRKLAAAVRRAALPVCRAARKCLPALRRVPRLAWVLGVCCGLGACLTRQASPLSFGNGKPAPARAPEWQAPAGGSFCLTFDDGPHPVHTPALLDWLKKHGLRATFFVLGENAERHPHLVRRMAAEGHEVANHSWSHPNLRLMSPAKMRAEIQRAHDLIQKLTGRAPAAFRAPYGSLSPAQKALVEREFGYRVLLWNVDTLDWKHRNSAEVADILRAGVREGSIVLAHDIHGRILPALEQVLPEWRAAGLRPVSLGELLPLPKPPFVAAAR